MMEEILVGIDVGTTKVCTLVGRVEDDKSIRILGVGIELGSGTVTPIRKISLVVNSTWVSSPTRSRSTSTVGKISG